jgi:hypothetical protein
MLIGGRGGGGGDGDAGVGPRGPVAATLAWAPDA